MVFLMANTWCSKHTEDAKNWIETLIFEKCPFCWFTLHNYINFNIFFLKVDLTRCSNEISNNLTNTHQHNEYLMEYIGYMFRPVNRSSSGLQQNKSEALFRYWDPNIIFMYVHICKNIGIPIS